MPTAPAGVEIHPSAVVSEDARLAPGVQIGPGCVLDGPVVLEQGVRLIAGVFITGPAVIGARTIVYPGACLGFGAQDYKVKPGDPTPGVRIGADCLIREHVTVHAATKPDRPTTIGDHVFMMVGSHAGHDCQVGARTILVNRVELAGHVEVGEKANLSAHVLVHQFCRIGRMAMVSGNASFVQDLPPFCLGAERSLLHGINVVGLRRAGVAREDITLLRAAYRDAIRVLRSRSDIIDALRRIGEGNPLIDEVTEFYRTSKRGVGASAALPPRYLRSWLKRLDQSPDDAEGDADGME